MKFPRNARIFRGQLDAAPFAAVLFLLVIFMLLGSLVYTPGVRIQLPVGDGFVGTDKRTIAVSLDANGRYYFDNHAIDENELRMRLSKEVKDASEPLALVVRADEAATQKMFTRLTLLARQAGFSEAWLAILPRAAASSNPKRLP